MGFGRPPVELRRARGSAHLPAASARRSRCSPRRSACRSTRSRHRRGGRRAAATRDRRRHDRRGHGRRPAHDRDRPARRRAAARLPGQLVLHAPSSSRPGPLADTGWRVAVEGDAPLDVDLRIPIPLERMAETTPGLHRQPGGQRRRGRVRRRARHPHHARAPRSSRTWPAAAPRRPTP